MAEGDFVGARGEVVLAVAISAVAVDGNGGVGRNDIEIDGGNFGILPGDNTDKDENQDNIDN